MLTCRSENGGPVLARHGVGITARRNCRLADLSVTGNNRRCLKWSSTDGDSQSVRKFILDMLAEPERVNQAVQ
jgi:hypothetical protein